MAVDTLRCEQYLPDQTQTRTAQFVIRFTADEMSQLRTAAARLDRPVAQLVRASLAAAGIIEVDQ